MEDQSGLETAQAEPDHRFFMREALNMVPPISRLNIRRAYVFTIVGRTSSSIR